ncbi:hypothetical protein GCM10022255_089160 [Dactylosporangium darangshiense]|uniref:AB hydrolase-1 domain-containing protein n=3 Tax=Dactylosporangium darangshiense TaxID=579108 RepID=A0ABP8DNT4_9ACTN
MVNGAIILIHGFWSSPDTWAKLIDRIEADDELRSLRVHAFGYESPKLRMPLTPARIPDYNDIAQTLATLYSVQLQSEPRVAIVTHSQGGLILQRFLAWMLNEGRGRELTRLKMVVMLSCPNEGSEYLRSFRAAARFHRHPQARELGVLTKEAAESRRTVLRQVVNARGVDERQCPIPFHVYSGRTDNVVTRTSAQSAFPSVGALAGDHFSILDPDAPGNLTFSTLRKHLLDDLGSPPPAAADGTAEASRTGSTGRAIEFRTLIDHHVEGFIGRKFVFDRIDEFLGRHDRGYFAVEGVPGIGKTAVIANLVRHRSYVHHFNVAAMGVNSFEQFLGNVCAQLVARYDIRTTATVSDFRRDGAALSELLREAGTKAAAAGERLVVAVDAIDEVGDPGAGRNVLFLPPDLPQSVYFVLTVRPDELALRTSAAYSKFTIDPLSADNRRDARAYLGERISGTRLGRDLAALGVRLDDLLDALVERSEGNFMYLHYILPAIAEDPAYYSDTERLPQGLTKYYEDHWRRMRSRVRETAWERSMKIIYVLSESEQAVPLEWIAKYAGESPFAVQEVLGLWRPFLDLSTVGRGSTFRIYHASFREFLRRDDTVRSAGITLGQINEQIANQQLRAIGIDLD